MDVQPPCPLCGEAGEHLPGCSDRVTYRLEYPGRPWTTNAERKGNHWERAKLTKEWRSAFTLLARAQRIPPLAWFTVIAEPHQKGGRLQDVAGCAPAVKAAIDGLVDARIAPDDSSEFLRLVTFAAPQRGKNALVLYVTGYRTTD